MLEAAERLVYDLGPGRTGGAQRGFELVAAQRIGRETVTYVSNIYKYYLAYQMVLAQDAARRETKAGEAGGWPVVSRGGQGVPASRTARQA